MPIGMFDILDAYWVAGTNPGTQVFSTALGVETFISNTAPAYQNWLAAGNFGTALAVTAESAGNAGTVRLTLDASTLTSGQCAYFSGLTGTPAANGIQTFTKIDATHIDINGSTFGQPATPTGAVLTMAAILPTDAALWAVFDGYAQAAWKTRALTVTSVANTTNLSTPLPSVLNISAAGILHSHYVLPIARSPRSPPLGLPVRVSNDANGAGQVTFVVLYYNDTTSIVCFVGLGDEVQIVLTDNSTANGVWKVQSPTRNTGLFAARKVSGKRNAAFLDSLNYTCAFATLMSPTLSPPASLHLFSNGVGSSNIANAGPVQGGRDQAAAFVAGDIVHCYILGDNFGLGGWGICSKQAPSQGGPLGLPFTGAGVTFSRWVYITTVILIAGPLMPNVTLSGDGVFFNNAAADGVALTGGAATAETTVTVNTIVPQQYATKWRLLVSATTTNANTLSIYHQATNIYASIPVPAGARVVFELLMPMNHSALIYLAYKWAVATGSVDFTILGYHVSNGDS